MKQIFRVCILLVSLLTTQMYAQKQEKTRAILLNAAAETRGFTLSYEQKVLGFGSIHSLSLRGAIGYGFNRNGWWLSTYNQNGKHRDGRSFFTPGDLEQYSLSTELNYRLGKKKHFLEIGQGISLDIFSAPVNFHCSKDKLGLNPTAEEVSSAPSSKYASHFNTRAGYRFVANNGLTLGIGVSMHWYQGLFTHFYAMDYQALPYLSIGYSF